MAKIIKKQIISKMQNSKLESQIEIKNNNLIYPINFHFHNINRFSRPFYDQTKNKFTVAITGATGLLGSNLLFEIIKQNIDNLDNLDIILFGRSEKNISFKNRIINILNKDGFNYLGLINNNSLFEKILSTITFIELNFLKNDFIDQYNMKKLQEKNINYFFHIAAYTDFRSTPIITQKLYDVNVNGTKNLMYLINNLKVNQFIFTGSAYSVGYNKGEIFPDYFSNSISYRNSYEKTKMEAEQFIINFCKANKIIYKIFRLTGICGRLIEKPFGYINKYDIFYGWAQFFLKYKYYILKDKNKLYSQQIKLPLRIHANFKAGMNIIPADYAAKLLYQIPIKNKFSEQYHLVNDIDIPYKLMIDTIFNSLNITGYKIVNNEPKNKNRFEDFYYRTVGKIFTPYAVGDNIVYNNESVNKFARKLDITIPKMTIDNFKLLIEYAKNEYFGIFKDKFFKSITHVSKMSINEHKVIINR